MTPSKFCCFMAAAIEFTLLSAQDLTSADRDFEEPSAIAIPNQARSELKVMDQSVEEGMRVLDAMMHTLTTTSNSSIVSEKMQSSGSQSTKNLTQVVSVSDFNESRVLQWLKASEARLTAEIDKLDNKMEILHQLIVQTESTYGNNSMKPDSREAVMYVDLTTDAGDKNLKFVEGETVALKVKLSVSGFFYVMGCSIDEMDQQRKECYLVDFSNTSGTNQFLKQVSSNEAGRWLELGAFVVTAPLGLEELVVIASPNYMGSLPAVDFEERSGLYVIKNMQASIIDLHEEASEHGQALFGDSVQFLTTKHSGKIDANTAEKLDELSPEFDECNRTQDRNTTIEPKDELPVLPLWVENPSVEGYYGAVGVAGYSRHGMRVMMPLAEMDARANLAMQITTIVTAQHNHDLSKDGNHTNGAYLQSHREATSRVLLAGAKKINQFLAEDGKLYVHMVVKKGQSSATPLEMAGIDINVTLQKVEDNITEENKH